LTTKRKSTLASLLLQLKSFSKAGQVGQIWGSPGIFPFNQKDNTKASKGLKIEVKNPSQVHKALHKALLLRIGY
jgi:hypothetical protein